MLHKNIRGRNQNGIYQKKTFKRNTQHPLFHSITFLPHSHQLLFCRSLRNFKRHVINEYFTIVVYNKHTFSTIRHVDFMNVITFSELSCINCSLLLFILTINVVCIFRMSSSPIIKILPRWHEEVTEFVPEEKMGYQKRPTFPNAYNNFGNNFVLTVT